MEKIDQFRDIITQLTTQIRSSNHDGSDSTGTGFFHVFNKIDKHKGVLCVITNKHVVENSKTIEFTFTSRNKDGSPCLGTHQSFGYIVTPSLIQYHEDPNVDLVAIPIIPLISHAEKIGFRPFYRFTDQTLIARDEFHEDIFYTEDILMVGYPIGIWDATNNLPIVRKGICATPPHVRHNGKNQFVIDAHCFPGSSGSPVFVANTGAFYSKSSNAAHIGQRVALVGILFAGPQYTAEGGIVVKNIPTSSISVSQTSIPAGLGYCIKSDELDYFEKLFKEDKFPELEITVFPANLN